MRLKQRLRGALIVAGKIIYFSRHGETDWNVSQRIQGQLDIDINANGQRQAERNGDMLKSLIGDGTGYDFVASPLRRTRETMEIIRVRMGIDPYAFRVDPQLMEVNFGDWQGYMMEDIAGERQDLIDARARDKWNFVPPGDGAESYMILANRMKHWPADSLRHPRRLHPHAVLSLRENGRP
jgi:broad specificity phosphatase PhoE